MNLIEDKALFFRRVFLILYDVIAIFAAATLAILMRFDFQLQAINTVYMKTTWRYLPLNIVITILIFAFFRLYQSLWAYAGATEMVNIVSACIISSITQAIGILLFNRGVSSPVPRSYYFFYTGLLLLAIVLSRYTYRAFRYFIKSRTDQAKKKNIMVIGAGDAGNALIKEIISSQHIQKVVKCVIDDNRTKIGNYIHGVRIIGDRGEILEAVARYHIDEIIIAMPSAKKSVIKEILDICKETKCDLLTLPGIYQLVNGDIMTSQLKKVDVVDLLGREPIQVDLDSIMGYVRNKVVLVTGGGGSIGSELCRQIASQNPKQLIIVDIYENNAYEIQQELIRKHPELDLVVLIASVRNTNRVNSIFKQYQPQIVYHAAAHKHVPLMEESPNEAIKNNVFGTWKTAQASIDYGVEKFVLISTDKAVNPTNIMGASKRMCEMIVQSYNKKSSTEFVAVRFGNVLGSNGSVIPLFKKQIEEGGPVTVTHPDIIRFFMTIPEAVSLVLQAGAYAKGGEIFILDMGEPVKIVDLAENLIRFSGFVPGEDIKIEFTGLRPGEKLYEEILMDEEGMQNTENKLIFIGKPIDIDEDLFFQQLDNLRQIVQEEREDKYQVKTLVSEIVPTYILKK